MNVKAANRERHNVHYAQEELYLVFIQFYRRYGGRRSL